MGRSLYLPFDMHQPKLAFSCHGARANQTVRLFDLDQNARISLEYVDRA